MITDFVVEKITVWALRRTKKGKVGGMSFRGVCVLVGLNDVVVVEEGSRISVLSV